MSVGMFMLVVIFGGLIFVAAVAGITRWSDSKEGLSSQQRAELASLRRLVKEINAEAHRYQELEPNFTSTTIDKISNHYQKELES